MTKEERQARTLDRLAVAGEELAGTMSQIGAIAIASQAVVSHRVGMALEAFSDPAFAEHAEFTTMTTEKIDAIQDVGARLMDGFWTMGQVFAQATALQGFGFARAAFEIGTAASPSAALEAQQRWAANSLKHAEDHALRMAEVLGNLTSSAVEPIHSRATANAKRLSKRG